MYSIILYNILVFCDNAKLWCFKLTQLLIFYYLVKYKHKLQKSKEKKNVFLQKSFFTVQQYFNELIHRTVSFVKCSAHYTSVMAWSEGMTDVKNILVFYG